MIIDAEKIGYKEINDILRTEKNRVTINNCLGQRFIATGMSNKKIIVNGVPGNALGSYLNGAEIAVHGNAQDAVGDTMNNGEIVVFGNVGDAAGYAMRGGLIMIKGDAGYRAGIHMKAYGDMVPVMVIGGKAGSFLGEYQAGGIIIVLGLGNDKRNIVGNFPCTGMHGGKMFLRSDCKNISFPKQVTARTATAADLKEISRYIEKYSKTFGVDKNELLDSHFTVVTPNNENPYNRLYVAN